MQLGELNSTLSPVSDQLLRENGFKVDALPRKQSSELVENDANRENTSFSESKGGT